MNQLTEELRASIARAIGDRPISEGAAAAVAIRALRAEEDPLSRVRAGGCSLLSPLA